MTYRRILFSLSLVGGLGCGEVTTGGNEGPAPTIESFDPIGGRSAGGTDVTITGSGFLDNGAGGASVVVGDRTATDVTVVDDSTLTVTTPPGPPGELVELTVFNENGFGDASELYLYNEIPRAQSITPAVGPATGGTTITINGRGFDAIDSGTTTVMIGNAAASNVTIVSDTQITAQTGPLGDTAFAALNVSIINNNGTTSIPSSFKYTQQGLLGTTRQFGTGAGIETLFYLNPVTLEVAEVAELPVKMSNFAYNSNGELFGVSTQQTTLFRIDTDTFETEAIGQVTNATMGSRRITELAFIGAQLFGFDRNERLLVAIDTSTGAGTSIGTAITAGLNNGVCLRIRDGASFFFIQNLDQNMQFMASADSSLAAGPAMNGPVNVRCHGIADLDGDVYVSTARDLPGGSDTGRLFTIDVGTGVLTEVGALPFNFTSLFPTPASF